VTGGGIWLGKSKGFREKDKARIQSNADKHPEREDLQEFKEKVQSKVDRDKAEKK
jgi:hypothetical protein